LKCDTVVKTEFLEMHYQTEARRVPCYLECLRHVCMY